MNYIILIFIAVCGVVFGVFFARRDKCECNPADSRSAPVVVSKPLNSVQGKQSKKKADNKEKVLFTLKNSKEGKITNNDVEKLCGVSHATAERYLDELKKSVLKKAFNGGL